MGARALGGRWTDGGPPTVGLVSEHIKGATPRDGSPKGVGQAVSRGSPEGKGRAWQDGNILGL